MLQLVGRTYMYVHITHTHLKYIAAFVPRIQKKYEHKREFSFSSDMLHKMTQMLLVLGAILASLYDH